jgi:hypothetical protein
MISPWQIKVREGLLWIVAESQVAPDDMLQEPNSLSVGEIVDHDAEDINDGMEPFIRMTNIRKSNFVEEDLLHNKYRDGFR